MSKSETRPHAFLRQRLRAALVDLTHGKTAREIADFTGLPLERAIDILQVAEDGSSGMTTPMRWASVDATPPAKTPKAKTPKAKAGGTR